MLVDFTTEKPTEPKPKRTDKSRKAFTVFANSRANFSSDDFDECQYAAAKLMRQGVSVWLAKTGSFVAP